MVGKMKQAILIAILLVLQSCLKENADQEPQNGQIDDGEVAQSSFEIYLNSQKADSVIFKIDTVFGNGEDVFIDGYIHDISIDSKDRMFIAASKPGVVGVYVFESDGTFLKKIARAGRGPGEYEGISSISIFDDRLYLFDPRLQKIGIFSVDGYQHIKDSIIDLSYLKQNDSKRFSDMFVDKLFVRDDGVFLFRLRARPRNDPTYQHKMVFLQSDDNMKLHPSPSFEVKSHNYYFPEGQLELPFQTPFTRSSIVAINSEGQFYSNWTDDFKIKVHNSDFVKQRSFFALFDNANLNINELHFDRNMERTLSRYELPDTWPAIHTMELDDEGRLWVATITENESDFTWYILNGEGDVIARFLKFGRRSRRSVREKPLITIKGEYFYLHERELRQGIDRIVKYKIEFINR